MIHDHDHDIIKHHITSQPTLCDTRNVTSPLFVIPIKWRLYCGGYLVESVVTAGTDRTILFRFYGNFMVLCTTATRRRVPEEHDQDTTHPKSRKKSHSCRLKAWKWGPRGAEPDGLAVLDRKGSTLFARMVFDFFSLCYW